MTANLAWTEEDVWPGTQHIINLALTGLIAGVASALLGIGSGVLIVPILTGFLHVPLKRAVGISIVTVFGVVLAGVSIEAVSHSNIQWLFALLIALGAQAGVWIGGKIGERISERALKYLFISLLFFTAVKLSRIVDIAITAWSIEVGWIVTPLRMIGLLGGGIGLFSAAEIWSMWLLAILGLGVLAGILSVLLGIGGGVVVVPGLLLLVEGIGFRAARATSLAVIVPTALSGTIIHFKQNNILWKTVLPLVVPGFLGAFGGVMLANSVPNEMLRQMIFPAFLAVMVVRLGLKKKRASK